MFAQVSAKYDVIPMPPAPEQFEVESKGKKVLLKRSRRMQVAQCMVPWPCGVTDCGLKNEFAPKRQVHAKRVSLKPATQVGEKTQIEDSKRQKS